MVYSYYICCIVIKAKQVRHITMVIERSLLPINNDSLTQGCMTAHCYSYALQCCPILHSHRGNKEQDVL